MSLVRFRPEAPDAGVAHPVERHLAKVEVASSSLVTRSKKVRNVTTRSLFHMVPWPSGKARVCKTLIRQFKSGRYLQKETHTKRCAFSFWRNRTDRFEDLNAARKSAAREGSTERHLYFHSPKGMKMLTNLAGNSLELADRVWYS